MKAGNLLFSQEIREQIVFQTHKLISWTIIFICVIKIWVDGPKYDVLKLDYHREKNYDHA